MPGDFCDSLRIESSLLFCLVMWEKIYKLSNGPGVVVVLLSLFIYTLDCKLCIIIGMLFTRFYFCKFKIKSVLILCI